MEKMYCSSLFYEFYGVENNKMKKGCIYDVAYFKYTSYKKSIPENNMSNPLMAGFPSLALKKYIHLLLDRGYTVVLVEQVTSPPNPDRKVTNIYSPGTYIEESYNNDSNYIACIFIEEETDHHTQKKVYGIGLSVIDLTIGNNSIYEVYDNIEDPNYKWEESIRFLHSYHPHELIIYGKNITKYTEQQIKYNLDVNSLDCQCYYYTDIESNYYQLSYQQDFFKKIFPNTGMLSVFEYLELEKKPYATLSYLCILQFSYEHNEKIIQDLQAPTIWTDHKHLILANHAIIN